jgi:GNAT superfamily N-acetyltransferase
MNLELDVVQDRAGAGGLTALLEQAVREAPGPAGTRTPEDVARHYLEVVLEAPEALVVRARPREVDRPLALAASAPAVDPLTGQRTPLLVLLYVDPSIRHRGVARALVRELRGALAGRGLGALWARAAHNDDALISMGERWGFVREWEWMSSE